MKTYYIIPFLALVSACQNDDVRPLMKIEAKIGEPFTVSAPAEVTFKESSLTLYIDTFSHYINFGFNPPRTTAVIRYRDRKVSLSHGLNCDSRDCEGFTHNENTFSEEAKLGELYTLRFSKVIASTMVREYEPGGEEFRVDSAEFVLRVK
ncbi:MAG: hypothetical protein WD824_19675 [Cyclobacteriaceae bacterium]